MSWAHNFLAGGNMLSKAVAPIDSLISRNISKPNFNAVFNAVTTNGNSDVKRKIEPLCTEPPDRVSAVYKNDLDITMIHEAILSRFEYMKKTINKQREKIAMLRTHLYNVTLNEHKETMLKIDNINKEIVSIESGTALHMYIVESEPLLNIYKSISKTKIVNIKINSANEENYEKIEQRCSIIEKYLDIARKWIIIDVKRIIDIKIGCPSCGKEDNSSNDDSEGYSICECGYATETLSTAPSYKDSMRINSGCRNNYEDKENFRKALNNYQCKQVNKPPSLLYEQIDKYAISIGNHKSSYFLALPLDKNGKKEGTSKYLMLTYLRETKNTAYYEDINLICHMYWGWSVPNISHLEDKIMQDYDRTQDVYNSIPNKDRIASLNIQFRLYVHLKVYDVPCLKEDFKMQVQRESLLFHQDCWNKMCAATGLKCVQVI